MEHWYEEIAKRIGTTPEIVKRDLGFTLERMRSQANGEGYTAGYYVGYEQGRMLVNVWHTTGANG